MGIITHLIANGSRDQKILGDAIMIITVLGTPIAKARPRFYRRGNFVGVFNPQETIESRFLYEVKTQWGRGPLEGPLKVKCRFCMPIPKSTSKKKVELMLAGEIQHTSRPDLSNLIKFFEDACNFVLWKDDSQIVTLIASKFYDLEPKTEIEIEEGE
jgi:Holliday junction resolvase RusA-like endonuclease